MKLSLLQSIRTVFILPTTLLYTFYACAQAAPAGGPHDARAFMQTSRLAAKGTGSLPRMAAHVNYAPQNGALTPIDSAALGYNTAQAQSPASQTIYRFVSGQWKLYSRYEYTYDTRGNNVVSEYSIWSTSSNSYTKLVRYNYSYNGADAKTALFYEIWDMKSNSYGNGLKEVYTLNGRNNVIDYVQELWINAKSVWQNSEHYTYTYTPQELMEESFYQFWDINATPVAAWRNKTRHFYTYDASGKNRVADTTYQWTGNSWEYSKLNSSALNAAGLPATTTDRNYNSNTTAWYPTAEHTYTYNAARGMLTALHTQWDATSASFLNSLNATQAYNGNGQPTILNTETWTGIAWAVGIGSERNRNYYEGDLQLGIKNAGNTITFKVSPVPALEMLYIAVEGTMCVSPATATLTNMQGQVVASCPLSAETDMSVSTLPAGTYLLTVMDKNGASASRVVPVVH